MGAIKGGLSRPSVKSVQSAAKTPSSTISNLSNPVAAFTAALLEKAHGTDRNAFLHGFAHIVERQSSDGGRCHSLHFHACFGFCSGGCFNLRTRIDHLYGNIEMRKRQWMAERDQFRGFLGGLDTCNSGHFQRISLRHRSIAKQL